MAMAFNPFSKFIVALYLIQFISGGYSATFTITDKCSNTVWLGILSNAGTAQLPTTGFALQPGESSSIAGLVDGTTSPSHSRLMAGLESGGNCTTTGCVVDLNVVCPSELKVTASDEGVACKSACEAWPRGADLTLGELLKYKSEQGVRVLLLVCDDKTSHDKLGNKVVGTLFTHHQKCILVDTKASGSNRKITAFLGGLDLCDGCYDTPEHRLFRDLDTVFHEDFHQPTFPAGTKAPRQPSHDLHCRIDGPAAYDVLINFEQRWRKATHLHDDALFKMDRISWMLCPTISVTKESTSIPKDDPALWVHGVKDPENCHVQIFRSVDSGSLQGFPKEVNASAAQNLICSRDLVIDKSIQTAYIQAIRSAQHFIYIETQYFIGSSYAWPDYRNAGADNLIPMELALKITSKIRANERFAVYIVLPMWPEGDPKTNAIQEILYCQSQTMQMMYDVVARELRASQLQHSHPQDYLNFYCLGNREELSEETSNINDAMISDAYKYHRFMIDIHGKAMIVDDEYVIVGSANINQRSMAGTEDTEIAMGAYQPLHTWAKQKSPYGRIYGYRMSLWAEHLGDALLALPIDAGKLDCMKKVNVIAKEDWRRFTSPEFIKLPGHLLMYPVSVDADGKVGPLPGHENFPDVGGKVLGARSFC
ncbi:hypothetical protein M0R45_003997 [Rubus argutus]|uniref:phospholipase D n=1 Tax=Rubus argutus TaxID=59490 RepID=A0AAW1YIL5_RUBAR